MLQNLANKPQYAKEQYMMSLNPFVENNKSRINQFLNNLCDVGDFYESLEVCTVSASSAELYLTCFFESKLDQYMALSKKDLMINITMNEMYNTHALIQQHIDVLVSIYCLGGRCCTTG